MIKLVLLRHGESEYNKEDRFTGWTDIELTKDGLEEARMAGEILKRNDFYFDIAFTSVLKRTIRSLWIVLHQMDLMWIPIYKSWRLNERHYGALQGLNKAETTIKYGEEMVYKWRRSVEVRPPALDRDDQRYPGFDIKYKDLKVEELPVTENLEDVEKRVLDYWNKSIIPPLKEGKKVIIVSHGNTIRALVRYLDNIPPNGIVDLNIPTGIPIVYELNEELKPMDHYYIGFNGKIEQNKIPKSTVLGNHTV